MRLPAKPLSTCSWYLRPFFWNQRRKYGKVLDAALLWARSPKAIAARTLSGEAYPRIPAITALRCDRCQWALKMLPF
jgi:hypothetical protein